VWILLRQLGVILARVQGEGGGGLLLASPPSWMISRAGRAGGSLGAPGGRPDGGAGGQGGEGLGLGFT